MTMARQMIDTDLRVGLHAVTFVVVDLETTGGSPRDSRITEFGAVRIRGGEVLGELSSLVDPGVHVPTAITRLTGITTAMASAHPPVEAVLPSFLEFIRGAVLVAHNARFDLGFLQAACARLDYPRLDHPVVCTAALARRLVRDEVRNVQLATLAHHLRCQTRPVHRALADARATVEVFHGLLERAAGFGVETLEDLLCFGHARNAPLYATRRRLSDHLPHAPGVYSFRSASGEVLYVGKATDLRARVRSYFGQDDRRQVIALMKETAAVDHVTCPTPLEAAVRELRLIAAHRPRFNRRSKHPERAVYVKLTAEQYPRLSIVRVPRDDGGVYLGPLGTRRVAERVCDALYDVAPLRRCTQRLSRGTTAPLCALAGMGRCPAPCDGQASPEQYAPVANRIREVLAGDPGPALAALVARMGARVVSDRFERAADARDRIAALVQAIQRTRDLVSLAGVAELVAVRRRRGTCEVVLVRQGRLVGTRAVAAGAVGGAVDELRATPPCSPELSGAGPALIAGGVVGRTVAGEAALLADWLALSGVEALAVEGSYAQPWAGGQRLTELRARLAASRRTTGRPGSELAQKRLRRDGPGQSAPVASRRDAATNRSRTSAAAPVSSELAAAARPSSHEVT